MDEHFFVEYGGKQVRVTPVDKGSYTAYEFDLNPPVVLQQDIVDDLPTWIEADKGETKLSVELGDLIEKHDF